MSTSIGGPQEDIFKVKKVLILFLFRKYSGYIVASCIFCEALNFCSIKFSIIFYLYTVCPPSCEERASPLSGRGPCSLRTHPGFQGCTSCGWEFLGRSCRSAFPQGSSLASAGIQQTGWRCTNCTKKEKIHLYSNINND